MVKYTSSDLISIYDFAFAWRVTDSRWDKLPVELLEHIYPLSVQRSAEICRSLAAFQHSRGLEGCKVYQISSRTSLEETTLVDSKRIANWLVNLPVQQSDWVYVCWGSDVAAVVVWHVFIQVWNSLWYPFDAMCVFDETLGWAVMFGPEELAICVERKVPNGV